MKVKDPSIWQEGKVGLKNPNKTNQQQKKKNLNPKSGEIIAVFKSVSARSGNMILRKYSWIDSTL